MVQRFTAHDYWRTSPVTREVSALAFLGFPVVVEQAHDDLTGQSRTIFKHARNSVDPQRLGLPTAKELIRLYKSGELEKKDALHPLLDGLRAMASFDALEQWRLRGATCCLAADGLLPGQPPELAPRARLVAGIPPQGGEVCGVANVANAAALALVGVPVIALREHGNGVAYVMAATGVSLKGQPGVKTAELLQQARDGALAWDHPFLLGRAAVLALVKMLAVAKEAEGHVMITWRNRKDQRMAEVLSSSAPAAFDMAHRHMK